MLKIKAFQEFEPIQIILKKGNRISFCVYGTNPKYLLGAIHNVILAKTIYPEWICRFYIEKQTQLKTILKDMGAEVFVANEIKTKIHPMTWRLLTLEDELANLVIFRDADSRLNYREKAAVDKWVESGKSFHRMKESDHINEHAILPGMWGAKADKLRNIKKILSSYKNWGKPENNIPGDLDFVEDEIWPIVQKDHLYHGVANDAYGIATPFPPHLPTNYGFVGARVIDDKWGI